MSRFLNLHNPGEARTLEESFHPDDLRKAKTDWTKLNNLVRWKSTDKVPIDTVVKAEGGAAS